jgi:Domain of unknown function (DU1801)
MATSSATTVAAYLAELPPDRRVVVSDVRDRVRQALQAGFEEGMAFGMIGWTVPLSRYPDTYNKQPLAFVSLAAQKKHYSLYLMCAYADSDDERAITSAYQKAGVRLDMGKSCLRFTDPATVLWDVVEQAIGRYSVEDWIAVYERSRGLRR